MNPFTSARLNLFLIASIYAFSEFTHAHPTCGGKGHDSRTEVPKEIAEILSSYKLANDGKLSIRPAPSKPSIVSRSSWGCSDGQSSPLWSPQYTVVTHVIVHHSATANSSSSWPGVVRSIFADHRNTQGWGDIGYNYLIDPNGVIYEGRAGGDNVIGAHFSCMNGGTMGVCLLGTFDSSDPTQAALNSLNSIIAWKCDQRDINPTGSSFHSNSSLTLYNISGHRDGNSASTGCPKGTVCPGSRLYAKLPEIRSTVNSLINSGTVSPPSVRTDAASSITSTSAILNGTITNDGGGSVTTRQFGWGTDPVTHSSSITNSNISVSGNSFSATLSGLQPNTTYYFSAWAKNGSNANWGSGQILSFKTSSASTPPTQATNPSPSNGATGQSLNQTLTWSNGGGATSYDVYFGTDSSPDSGELEGTQISTSFNPPTLAYNTTYYWRIDARNSNYVTPGVVWSFTTGSAPTTKVISLSGVMDFGTVAVGSSAGAALRISNSGNSTLSVSGISYPPGFSGNWSSGTISAGGYKDVAVTFAPTSAASYGGTITVSSDKTSGTNTIACSGTGATTSKPTKAANPGPTNGATGLSLNQTLTWSNGGGATSYDVYFGTDSSPDSGELEGTQTSTSFNPPTLAYNTTYYWRIDARNSNGATPGDVWSFTTGAAPATRVIALSGIMDFGTVAVGSSAGATLRISNSGNSALAVSAIAYPSGFTGNWSSGAIAAGGYKDVAVTFAPTSATSYGGTITVSSDKTGGTNTILCSGTGTNEATRVISLTGQMLFGNVTLGKTASEILMIENSGNSSLTVSGISYPAGFSGDWAGGTINAGATKIVFVTFSPSSVKSYGGTITVNSDKTGGVSSISCSGNGVPAKSEIDLRPYRPSGWSNPIVISRYPNSTVQSEGLVASEELFLNWAVENSGTKNIVESFDTRILIDDFGSAWSNDGLKTNYYTYLKGRSIGKLSAGTHRIRLIADSGKDVDEFNESNNVFELIVKVAEKRRPEIHVTLSNSDQLGSGSTINFGSVQIGESRTKRIMIWNRGSKALNVSGIRLVDNDMRDYSISSVPFTLVQPGARIEVIVTLSPRSTITSHANIRIFSNDANEGIYTLKLRGTGS